MASTMDEILLPKPVARRLRGTLAWVDPDGWMHKSRALTRAYDDFQGMWAEMTLTPYLFPATTSRNATSEYLNSAFAGTHPVSFGRAMEMVQGIDAPLSNARRLLEKDFDAVDAAREATKSLDHFFGSPEHRQALGDEVGSNAAQRFFGTALRPGGAERLPDGRFLVWDDLPDGTMGQRPMSLLELREQAAALGMTDLGSLREIRTGLKHEADRVKQSTPREYLHSVFGDPTKELSDATLVHRKVHRGIMRYAEEVPRLAQFLEGTIERGLTPKESAAWVRAHHVDTTKPMTWAEKKVFRRAVPFYRWMKFAIPYGFKIALTRPWIPATVAKTMDFLTSGDAEKELTPENVPRYMRKWGLYFPVKIEKDADGKPVVSFVTPQGVVPVFDIMQWTTSWRNAGDSVQRALSPIVQTVKMLGSALDRRGAPISSRTGLPLEGETKYLGFTVDRWVAELLDQWRAVSTIDRYVTENKDTSDILQDPLSTENLTNHFNPFTLRQVDLRASQKQNEGSMAAILMEMQRRGRSELRRLERQGADTTELAEKQKALEVEFRQLMEDLKR